MNFKQRISTAYKIITQQTLGSSSGSVMRNYARQSSFRPQEQVTGITYKAIDKIGLTLSIYEPIVSKKNGEPYANHPLYNLYKQPNPRQTASDFIHLYAMLMEIYGETFWYKASGLNSGKTKELYLLNPSAVELKVHDGELLGYILHKGNGEQIPFMPEEILHDKHPNPFNEWRGMSVLEKAAVYVDTEITTSVFTLNYIKNNASPSGIVSLPDMDKQTFKAFASQWREGYEGPENAGKTAFIRGGEASFKAVGATLKDIDQKVTRDMAKADVLMMLDVPKELLGMTNDSGFGRNTIEAFELLFARNKLEPMMKRLDRIYMLLMQGSNASEASAVITHHSPIPEDKEYQLQMYKEGVGKWLTANEIRNHLDLDDHPDGDKLIVPSAPGIPAPPPPAKALETKRVTLKKAGDVDKTKALHAEREAFRKKLVEVNEVYALKAKAVISQFATKQQATVIDNINARGKAFEWLFNVKDDSEILAASLSPVMIDLMEAQAEDVANFITGKLVEIGPEVRKIVEHQIKQVAGVYNTDTLKALEKSLVEGQAQGESLVKLKKRVEKIYGEAKGYRAERIARTEALRNSNATAEYVYQQNGYSTIEWFVNPGACEFCQTYAGQTKEVGGTYTHMGDVVTGADGGQMRIEYTDIDTPPLHPNCTCSLVPGA